MRAVPCTCKRGAASAQRRKLEKRRDAREVALERARRLEARARAEAFRPPAPAPAATSEREATARVEEARDDARASGEALRRAKEEARASEAWDPNRGYKKFPNVTALFAEYDAKRARWVETKLERALTIWGEVTGGEFKTLEAFNWYYGEDLDARDGANAKSVTYMLPAVMKASAPRAVAEICEVACRIGAPRSGAIDLGDKLRAQAVAKLEEAAEFDLLEDDELETLEALRSWVVEEK